MFANDDEANLILLGSSESVDSANREFYSKFTYPWPPMTFPLLEDREFETEMLNQSLGLYKDPLLSRNMRIWVAGCGTNQALHTALKFPFATVIGSDLSAPSLDLCKNNAVRLGVSNLILREESLSFVKYKNEFDYIICTGVIHHNADPSIPLKNISQALQPEGVLELMVYNRYHRSFTTAIQKAIRTVTRHSDPHASYDEELEVAKILCSIEPIRSRVKYALSRESAQSHIADAFIQPIEYSYTVESLHALATACDLTMVLPCFNQFDATNERSWALHLDSPRLQQKITALPDVIRWQVANLLLQEDSPMLWFFMRKRGRARDDKDEKSINQMFLDQRFVRASTRLRNYVRGLNDLDYKLSPRSVVYPFEAPAGVTNQVVNLANGSYSMREILLSLGINVDNQKIVSDLRIQTTTSNGPFLRAI